MFTILIILKIRYLIAKISNSLMAIEYLACGYWTEFSIAGFHFL